MILRRSMFEIRAELAFVPVLSQSFSQIYAQLQNCLLTRAGVTVYFNAQVKISRRLCTIMGEERQSTLRKKILVAFSYGDFYCNGRKRNSRIDILYFSPFVAQRFVRRYSNYDRRKQTAGCDILFFHDPPRDEILMDANRYRRNVYEGRVGKKVI